MLRDSDLERCLPGAHWSRTRAAYKKESIVTNRLVDINEAAEFLHVHPHTVRRYCREGVIPVKKIGRTWRFDMAEVSRALDTQVRGGEPMSEEAQVAEACRRA